MFSFWITEQEFLFKMMTSFYFILFSLEANYFIILWWFLPYIHMNQPWVLICSPSWHSSHLLPHPIPQGHPSAPALSTLSHASNQDWRSISHMLIYMFQCYSLKSSHPCLLPESKSLFFTSMSLLLSHIYGHRYHLSKFHIYIYALI